MLQWNFFSMFRYCKITVCIIFRINCPLCLLYNLFGQIIIMFLFVWQVEPIPSKPPRSFASPTTATTGKAIETGIIFWNVDRKSFTFLCFEKRSLIKHQLPFCRTRQQLKFIERFSELIKKYSRWAKISCHLVINEIISVSIALGTGTTATPPSCGTAGTSMTSSCTNTNSCQLSSSALSPPGASESSASTSSGMTKVIYPTLAKIGIIYPKNVRAYVAMNFT